MNRSQYDNSIGKLFPSSAWMTTLDTMLIRSNTRVKGMLAGKRRSSQFGSSLEFADYRPYVSGDDVRRIDWNLYGRTTKAYIRQYWDEQERNFHLYIDGSLSMKDFGEHDANKWLFAMRIAASIGYLALKGEDRLQMHIGGESNTIRSFPSMYGKYATFRLIQEAERELNESYERLGDMRSLHSTELEHGQMLDMRDSFGDLASMPRRPGVCWFFSDGFFDTGIEEVFQQLLSAKQEIVFVHILHEQERNPALQGELKLLDVETAFFKEVAISPAIIHRYRQEVEHFQIALKELCMKHGVSYYSLDSSKPYTDQFLHMLADQQTVSFKA